MSTKEDQCSKEIFGGVRARAESLAGGLLPHQLEDVAFVRGHHRDIVADDMGLCNTRQAIDALRHRAPEGPWLVVCPASVKRNRAREISFFDEALPIGLVGPKAQRQVGYPGFADVNYDVLEHHRGGAIRSGTFDSLRPTGR